MPYKVNELKPNYDKLFRTSPKYDPLYEEIYEKYTVLKAETSQRITRELSDKNLYLGDMSEHWPEDIGDIQPIVNYAATVDNKYADLLTAGEYPDLQMLSPTEDEQLKGYASAGEKLIYKILDDNHFARKIHYGAVNGSMLGDTFFYTYYDPNKQVGSEKGIACIDSISPFFIRVGFAKDNWDDIEYWFSEFRMTPRSIKEKYGIEVSQETIASFTAPSGGATTNAPFDGTSVETSKTYIPMITVIDYHDNEKQVLLFGDETFLIKKNNGHHGLFHIRNRTAPNEPWGYPDHYNIREPNVLLNRLYGQSNQIIDSHAAPIIIDKGNVLGGKKIKNRTGIVVTTAPYGPGDGLEYLQWNGNVFPVDKLITDTKEQIHDLSEMPAAAFGSYQPGTNSGFALQIQMQPTLMRVKIKQNAEWGPKIIEMYRHLLKMTLDHKKLGLPKSIADFEIKIRWPNPLPREDAREIQNQTALATNKFISKETARQNLLVEDVVSEEKKIEKETLQDATIAGQAQAAMQKPLLDAQAQAQAQAMQGSGQIQGQGETTLNSQIQPGQAPEQAFPNFPEQNRATPQSLGLEGGQSIAPTSKGG